MAFNRKIVEDFAVLCELLCVEPVDLHRDTYNDSAAMWIMGSIVQYSTGTRLGGPQWPVINFSDELIERLKEKGIPFHEWGDGSGSINL